jgi:hypothetical protein
MDRLKFHLILESGKKMEKEWNNRIRSGKEKMKGVLCYFMYVKEKILGENYKETHE